MPRYPARIAPPILASPIREMAIAPSADVVVMPKPASMPAGSMGPHISVIMAGKCAVMKPS